MPTAKKDKLLRYFRSLKTGRPEPKENDMRHHTCLDPGYVERRDGMPYCALCSTLVFMIRYHTGKKGDEIFKIIDNMPDEETPETSASNPGGNAQQASIPEGSTSQGNMNMDGATRENTANTAQVNAPGVLASPVTAAPGTTPRVTVSEEAESGCSKELS